VQKPDPVAFATVVRLLNVKPQNCLFIVDNPKHDVAGATAAGLTVALIDRDSGHGLSAVVEEAIATVGATPCHVVLMDLEFGGGMRGHRATAEITAAPGGPQVLVLTTYDSDADILAALDAGAIGYLLKDAPPDELAHALREAAGGRMTMSPTVAGRLDSRSRRSATTLSPREIEVLQLVADGLGNQEIAAGRTVAWRTLPRDEAFQIPDLIRTKINLLPEHIQEVRVVEIDGLDLQADGGTHVRDTSEIVGLKIVGTRSKGKSNKRLEIEIADPDIGID